MISSRRTFFAIFFFILVLIGVLCMNQSMRMQILFQLQHLSGSRALIIISLVYILCNLFFIPLGFPLNLLAGMLWGTLWGGLLINVLATFVAAVAFLIARKFGDAFLNKFFAKKNSLKKMFSVINRYDWQFIAMARINPIVPFSLSNYAFGLIPQLSFRHYLIATILANLLPCFVFASIGAAFKTFSFENPDIHRMILQIGIVLLFISACFAIKIFVSTEKEPHFSKRDSS